MFKKKKEEKKIPDNTYRVIKISKDALREFIYESFIDNLENFFGVTDGTKIVRTLGISWEDDSFIAVAENASDEPPFYNEFDIDKIYKSIEDTTTTIYAEVPYIELTQEQLDAIQEEE